MMASAPSNTDHEPLVRLEPVSINHVYDFHKLWSSEQSALYSQRIVNDNFEESQKAFQERFLGEAATRPWILKKAIMVPGLDGGVGREAAGFISAAGPSPNGLLLSYHLRPDCWNRGYATSSARLFLDEYWNISRMAPRNEIYTDYELDGIEQADSDQIHEIKHLIGEVDIKNKGSMRVMEKCGGKIIGSIEDELLRFQGPRSHAVWQLDKP